MDHLPNRHELMERGSTRNERHWQYAGGHELPAKHIEFAREILPRLTRVGQFVDKTATGCNVVEEQARKAALASGTVRMTAARRRHLILGANAMLAATLGRAQAKRKDRRALAGAIA